MNSISFTMSHWESLIDLNDSELVSMIRNIYRYASENIEPDCKDGAHRFMWKTFKDVIDSQKDIYDKRCSHLTNKDKTSGKKATSSRRKAHKSVAIESNILTSATPLNEERNDAVVTDSVTRITETDMSRQDLSFTHLQEIYPKVDSQDDFRAISERLWSELSEEDKGKAMLSIDKYIIEDHDTSRFPYLSQFLTNKVW